MTTALLLATALTGFALLFAKPDRLIESLEPLPAPPNAVAGGDQQRRSGRRRCLVGLGVVPFTARKSTCRITWRAMRLTLGNLLITSPPVRLWSRTFYASCEDVDSEFTAGFERVAPDRLESFSLPGSTTGKVMKVEVLDGDFLNGGWRAEALGETEGAG